MAQDSRRNVTTTVETDSDSGARSSLSSDRPLRARARQPLLYLLAFFMVSVGIVHFVRPEPFVGIVPKALPRPLLLVYVSGVFEIAGGIGLLIPALRKAAAWGLVLLYLAVFPANVNMAVNDLPFGDTPPNAAVAWGRLPFQALFIAWAWWFTRDEESRAEEARKHPA